LNLESFNVCCQDEEELSPSDFVSPTAGVHGSLATTPVSVPTATYVSEELGGFNLEPAASQGAELEPPLSPL